MVGTEATTGSHRRDCWSTTRQRGCLAALAVFLVSIMAPLVLAAEPADSSERVLRASGETLHRWQIGQADAYLLVGNVILLYGDQQLIADRAVIVVDGETGRIRSRIAAEGVSTASDGDRSRPWTATITTASSPSIDAPRYRGAPDFDCPLVGSIPELNQPALFEQSTAMDSSLASGVSQAQYQSPVRLPQVQAMMEPQFPPPPIVDQDGATSGGIPFSFGGGTHSVVLTQRGTTMPAKIDFINRPELNETIGVARGGVTLYIGGITAESPGGGVMQLGTVSISAERVVGWIPLMSRIFSGESDLSQADGEFYLEGDIVFRQGDRVIYADAMYYNVVKEVGMVLEAEAITTVPNYQGIVRLKADVMQQVSKGNFIAFDAAVTSSRMGVPRYWLQSERLQLNDRERILADPLTGAAIVDKQPYVTSANNFVYFGGVPLLYWPRFATSLDAPSFYIKGAKFGNDSIFGAQAMIDFDLLQLFGFQNVPPGVDWTLSTDYLSKRGPALGTNLNYDLPGLFGVPGPARGRFDAWAIQDSGLDTLGFDRRDLDPEQTTRGRALLRHRQSLANDFEFVAELGNLSDRNFLEQYFENEWDQDTDQRTALLLNKYYHNNQFSLSGNVQVNEFFEETEDPRFDHYLLGGSLLGDSLTYSTHSHVGYAKLNVADAPTNPVEIAKFTTLPGEQDREGIIASTMHELALPVQAGVLKVAPFISGEAAHYGEATDGDSLTRLRGQAGIRASLPMWRVDPSIQSSLLNVRGLAHKIEFTGEYFYADSDADYDELPLYDSLDDNAQEQFRRRFIFDNYGGALPAKFDPRTYALRHGLQSYVTAPSETVADDLQLAKVGIHQRFQTKRGLPGRERIVDLLRFDADLTLYPNGERDNFGESIGPATYDMVYNLGDRVSLLSDGYVDFFDLGLRSFSGGVLTSRPGLGDIYVGMMSLEGPISSTVLRSTLNYRLNEKWILSAGSTYDFSSVGNVGQNFALTRIGESFLVRLGVNIDPGRDNVGFGFMVEPRFLPVGKLGYLGGQLLAPPGSEGLE